MMSLYQRKSSLQESELPGGQLKNFVLECMVCGAPEKKILSSIVNLGIGIPEHASNFVPKDVSINIDSENGVLGLVKDSHDCILTNRDPFQGRKKLIPIW